MNTATRMTLQKWAERDGLTILDPDGFDRRDPFLMERAFTEAEYRAGIGRCTVTRLPGTRAWRRGASE